MSSRKENRHDSESGKGCQPCERRRFPRGCFAFFFVTNRPLSARKKELAEGIGYVWVRGVQMKHTIDIRRVTPEDAPAVREIIEGILIDEFPSEKDAYAYQDLDDPARYYGGKRDVFFVAERDGQIIGTIAVKEDDRDTALLRRVFVRKPFRGRGYGKRLLDKAIEFCGQHRYKRLMFHGTDRMHTALKLCQSNGFQREAITLLSDLKMVLLKRAL